MELEDILSDELLECLWDGPDKNIDSDIDDLLAAVCDVYESQSTGPTLRPGSAIPACTLATSSTHPTAPTSSSLLCARFAPPKTDRDSA